MRAATMAISTTCAIPGWVRSRSFRKERATPWAPTTGRGNDETNAAFPRTFALLLAPPPRDGLLCGDGRSAAGPHLPRRDGLLATARTQDRRLDVAGRAAGGR